MRIRLQPSPAELKASARLLKATLHDPETPPRDRSALARELRATLAALEAAKPAEKGDRLDDLAAKRKERRAQG